MEDNCSKVAMQSEKSIKEEDNELNNNKLEKVDPVGFNEECSRKNKPKYIGSYKDDGLLNTVYQVHEVAGDVYVLEFISYFDLIFLIESGYEPSQEPILKHIRELKLSEIENPRLFYSWLGIASEFVRAENERDRRERQKEYERNKGENG